MPDPNFRLHEIKPFSTPPYTARPEGDRLHFTGMLTYESGDLGYYNFGYTALYELPPERIPVSAVEQWRSAPHIDISGHLIGSTQSSFGWGDDWSKCWMIRRQTAFQPVFTLPGASPRAIIGERVDSEPLIFVEGAERDDAWRGHDRQPMPELILTRPYPAESIWVELEVRFEIQVEGNSVLWIGAGGELVVRGATWPAEPLGNTVTIPVLDSVGGLRPRPPR